jgi:hypothetical protein
MKHLDHPNVMKLMGICWATDVTFDEKDFLKMVSGPLIVLPYTELGNLRGYLQKKRCRESVSGNSYILFSAVRKWSYLNNFLKIV